MSAHGACLVSIWYLKGRLLISRKHERDQDFRKTLRHLQEMLSLWEIKAVKSRSFLEMESLFRRKTAIKDHSKPKYVHVAVSLMLCLMLAISASLQLQNTSSFASVHTRVLSCP